MNNLWSTLISFHTTLLLHSRAYFRLIKAAILHNFRTGSLVVYSLMQQYVAFLWLILRYDEKARWYGS